MKIIITEKERDYIISLLSEEDHRLKMKLLKTKRAREQVGQYKKSLDEKKKNFDKLEEIIRANYRISNLKLIEKLEISKATFYRVYSKRAKELKRKYKSQSLF